MDVDSADDYHYAAKVWLSLGLFTGWSNGIAICRSKRCAIWFWISILPDKTSLLLLKQLQYFIFLRFHIAISHFKKPDQILVLTAETGDAAGIRREDMKTPIFFL